MPLNEALVQSIVKEVVSRIYSTPAASAKHGIFAEMNDAIAAAKQAQAVVRNMTMEQREKIITNIRAKTRKHSPAWALKKQAWAMCRTKS